MQNQTDCITSTNPITPLCLIPVKLPPCHIYKSIPFTFLRYQTQKIIQGTVRSSSSLYTMNLGGLTVFQYPNPISNVNWHQSSDRMVPHGKGVDIKHNSYVRYMNRLKGKKPYRSEIINPVPPIYNAAYPIRGDKTVKTGFFDRCTEYQECNVLYRNV